MTAQQKRRSVHALALRILSFVLVFGIWEIAGVRQVSIAFPSFSATMAAFFRLIFDGTMVRAFGTTLVPLVIGVTLVGFFGVLFGILMGLYRTFEWFTLPVFIIIQSAPMAALIPLITFLYGIGLGAKVLAVILLAAPVIILNAYKGIRNANPTLIQMSRSFLANQQQRIMKIIIPDASGVIFAGLRLGVSQGFIGVILAELLITPTGIGDLITYYRAMALYPEMFAAIVAIVAFAAIIVTSLQHLEVVLFPRERKLT
jgi:NitT/TauT family transport system permease protein